MTSPFLCSGVGRSGTMWIARLLTDLGLVCGHEQQFTPDRHGPLDRPESSWLAMPFLADLPPGTPVVQMMRDPARVVQSVMRERFLVDPLRAPTVYDQFVARHRPWIVDSGDHLTRAIRWVSTWDEPIDDYAHVVVQIDSPDVIDHVRAAVRVATGLDFTAERVGGVAARLGRVNAARAPDVHVPTIQEIYESPEGWRVRDRAKKWGYANGTSE